MSDLLHLILAVLAGVGLGVVFFGGLWWTVRQGISSGQPARWLLVGGVLRMGIVLAGFYFVTGGSWQRAVACLAGFIVARIVVLRLTKTPKPRHAS